MGAYKNYVDRFFDFFDHPPTPCRQFIYKDLFTFVDIWLTTHQPPPVYVVFECPLTVKEFLQSFRRIEFHAATLCLFTLHRRAQAHSTSNFPENAFSKVCSLFFVFMYGLEIPASRVFLDADPQLLRISLAGARMPLSIVLSHFLNGI